jgi:hypothetical protein
MNKPIKPRKPSKPTKPSETTSKDVEFTFHDISSVEGKTLQELAEIACNVRGISVGEVDVSQIRIWDITFTCSDYWGDNFEMSIYIPAGERPNPEYPEQMKRYNKDMAAYKKKYATYKKNLSKYEEDLKKYEEAEKEAEIQKAIDILKKYGRTN